MYHKKHIGIVTLWFPIEKQPSYGIFVENQAAALAKIHDVTVILVKRSIAPYIRKSQKRGFRIIELGTFFLPSMSESFIKFKSKKYLKAFDIASKHQQIDVIHSHSYVSNFHGQYISSRRSVPHVSTIHDTTVLNDELQKWQRRFLSYSMKASDKVVAVGKPLANHLQKSYDLHNVVTIPNGVNTDLFSMKTEFWNGSRPFRFLFVGSFDKRKGLIECIEAFNAIKFKNTEFHIVGYDTMEKSIMALVKSLGLTSRVVFYGDLSNYELPATYHKCDAYVSFSSLETFGVTVIEAMSCGLPVLYSRSGGPEHTVAPYCGNEVQPRTVAALTLEMEEMIEHYEGWDFALIRNHAIAHFSDAIVTEQLCDLYEELI